MVILVVFCSLRCSCSRHLKPASENNRVLRRLDELYRVMKVRGQCVVLCLHVSAVPLKPTVALQDAVVAALKEFRAELPNLLPELVDEYVTDLVREPLFVEVRCVQ